MTQLYQLRDDLADSLGLAPRDAHSGLTMRTINKILHNSQEWLYWNYDWDNLRRQWSFATVANTQPYVWPTNGAGETVEPRKIIDAWITNGGITTDLREGVSPSLQGVVAPGVPSRYWRANQMNLWPIPGGVYTITLDGYVALAALAADTDVLTLDYSAVLELAIALGKQQYGKADGAMYLNLVNTLIVKLNARNDVSGHMEPITTPAAGP